MITCQSKFIKWLSTINAHPPKKINSLLPLSLSIHPLRIHLPAPSDVAIKPKNFRVESIALIVPFSTSLEVASPPIGRRSVKLARGVKIIFLSTDSTLGL